MARFPTNESDLATLADEMIAGLTNHADVYPAPPVPVEDLSNVRNFYGEARANLLDQHTAAQQATAQKEAFRANLIDVLKRNLRYAETTVGIDSERLYLLGWSPRRAPTPLSPPGQVADLRAVHEGEHTVDLAWTAPASGGRPSAYRVTRRERPAGPWLDVATALATEIHLTDQERGKEFEYRVIAVNKAGEGTPSNTVVVVL